MLYRLQPESWQRTCDDSALRRYNVPEYILKFSLRRKLRGRQPCFGQRVLFERVAAVIEEQAIVVKLVLLILRVSAEFEIGPARIVVTKDPLARLAFLSAAVAAQSCGRQSLLRQAVLRL